MRIGVISAYADEDWHAQQIARAARALGDVDLLAPTDFSARLGDGAELRVRGDPVASYDLVLTPRAIGEEGEPDLQLSLYQCLGELGVPVVNEVTALLTALDKCRTSFLLSRASIPTPPTRVVQTLPDALVALSELGDLVCKPLFGSLGIGVVRLGRKDADQLGALLLQKRGLYLQAYLESEYDVRAFVVGDRVEAAVARRPRAGDFRSNWHQGAEAHELSLDRETAELAVSASRSVGLDYAGVDLLLTARGPFVLEVNGTPSFRSVNRVTGRDMAVAIIDQALAKARGMHAANSRGTRAEGAQTEGGHIVGR